MANSEIPDEIVMDILKRLPVKSLMRFQCVSPAWRVLIKSPHFRKMQIKHQKLLKNNSRSRSKEDEVEYILVLSSPQTEDGDVRISTYARGHGGKLVPMQAPTTVPAFPHSKLELCAPCKGIFCAVANIDEDESFIYLCNPATHEYRRLPDRPFGFQPHKFPRSGVSFVKRTAWGFGIDPGTDEFKVVSVMYYGTPGDRYYFDVTNELSDVMITSYPCGVMDHGIIQFEIYELGSNTWREIKVVLPDCFGLVKRKRGERYVYSLDQWKGSGVFLNGCLHWLYGTNILCFDISSEVMLEFNIRSVKCRRNRYDSLVVLRGSLALVTRDPNDINSSISIWVMKKYGVEKSWVKRYTLAPYPVPLHPLHSWKDDDGDLLLFQAADPNKVETLVSCKCSGGGYHRYPIHAMTDPCLALQAIVISGLTLVSVESTTSDHTLVSGGSTNSDHTLVSAGSTTLHQTTSTGLSLSGYWGLALVILVNLYVYAAH